MSSFTETAFAKINLALHVRERRDDGYHRIETIFAFCEGGDALSAKPSDRINVDVGGPMAGGLKPLGDRLVKRAADLLLERAKERDSGFDGGAALELTKKLPVAGGLGGGSADAAAALRLLDRMWGLGLSTGELEELGRSLGADVPACVQSVTLRGDGRGDELEAVDLGISGRPVLLINPREQLSTAQVFARWDGIDRGPLNDWEDGRNDLEQAAISIVPQIGSVLAWLSAQRGVTLARMSGSGATCFALFDSDEDCRSVQVAVPREWWCMATRLR